MRLCVGMRFFGKATGRTYQVVSFDSEMATLKTMVWQKGVGDRTSTDPADRFTVPRHYLGVDFIQELP